MADRVGQKFGNYQLTRLLGKGGFAEVYLGEHIYLKSQAAIKVLLTQLGKDDTASFLAEARTLAALKHPHIVRILDFGMQDDVPFLVMDYASNGTLRQRYPRGTPLAPTLIVPYVKQVASALQYAHDQKLIHRDVKPENMLLQANNDVLLSDFGVALIAKTTHLTDNQGVIGTATYMAPEQIRGHARQSSDQYALAVVVYEWLSGSYLFQGSFTEVCAQHMFAAPEPLRVKQPDLSPEIEQVVMTALAKEPERRFASVQAFATALEQACNSGRVASVNSAPWPTDHMQGISSQPGALPVMQGISSQPGILPISQGPVSQPAMVPVTQIDAAQPGMMPVAQPIVFQQHPARSSAPFIQAGFFASPLWFSIQSRLPSRLRSPLAFIALFVILVLVFLMAGGGLFYSAMAHQSTQVQVGPTATPQAPAQETSIAANATTPTIQPIATTQPTPTPTPLPPTATPMPPTATPVPPTPTPATFPTTPQQVYTFATSGAPTLNSSLAGQDGNGWNEGPAVGGSGSCSFKGGAYHVMEPQTGYFLNCMATSTNFNNFAYQVNMNIISGANADGGGLIFRSSGYRLRIGVDGSCDLAGPSGFGGMACGVNIGTGQSHTITVVAHDQSIYIYIDRQWVKTVSGATTGAGSIGVFAVAWTTPTDVAFSGVKVWQL